MNKASKKSEKPTEKEKIKEIMRIYEELKKEEEKRDKEKRKKSRKEKREKKMEQPKPKRELNDYQKFVKEMSKKERFKNMRASLRISQIAELWRKHKEKIEHDSLNLSRNSFLSKGKNPN